MEIIWDHNGLCGMVKSLFLGKYPFNFMLSHGELFSHFVYFSSESVKFLKYLSGK